MAYVLGMRVVVNKVLVYNRLGRTIAKQLHTIPSSVVDGLNNDTTFAVQANSIQIAESDRIANIEA